MKNLMVMLCIGFFSFFSQELVAASNPSAFFSWEHLGSKKVDYKIDRDVIHVGLHEGSFKKLKIQVTSGSLNMRRMVVEYKNGQKETIELRQRFKQGTGSRVIDLNGNNRIIKDITFYYDSVNNPTSKAKVHVFGKH